jgi:signal transduction histidine kinase
MSENKKKVQEVFNDYSQEVAKTVDRMFVVLFFGQWVLALTFALLVSPRTWQGGESQTHIHVYAAALLGGLLTLLPSVMVLSEPGRAVNRYVITVSQIFFSILFIHLTGGRIEAHFHIFGSIAFIAFYREWRLVVLATAMMALDHFLRGIYWPQSIYGVLAATPWRALEHAAWVLFEDIGLFFAIDQGRKELWMMSERQVMLEELNSSLKGKVEEGTKQYLEAEAKLMQASKLTALGEMAGGVAHEINNPLATIQMVSSQLMEVVAEKPVDSKLAASMCQSIVKTTDRIAKIVLGLRTFCRDGSADPFMPVETSVILSETVTFCQERFRCAGVRLEVECPAEGLKVNCSQLQLSQVVLNFLNNAYDAISQQEQKWVKLTAQKRDGFVLIFVTDNGPPIPEQIRKKIFQPFFTTKEIGKGTGIGLSISLGIAKAHGGKVYLGPAASGTCFVLELPLHEEAVRAA